MWKIIQNKVSCWNQWRKNIWNKLEQRCLFMMIILFQLHRNWKIGKIIKRMIKSIREMLGNKIRIYFKSFSLRICALMLIQLLPLCWRSLKCINDRLWHGWKWDKGKYQDISFLIQCTDTIRKGNIKDSSVCIWNKFNYLLASNYISIIWLER